MYPLHWKNHSLNWKMGNGNSAQVTIPRMYHSLNLYGFHNREMRPNLTSCPDSKMPRRLELNSVNTVQVTIRQISVKLVHDAWHKLRVKYNFLTVETCGQAFKSEDFLSVSSEQLKIGANNRTFSTLQSRINVYLVINAVHKQK